MSVPVIFPGRDQAQIRFDNVQKLFRRRILRAMVGDLQHLELLSRPPEDPKQVLFPLLDNVPGEQAVELSKAERCNNALGVHIYRRRLPARIRSQDRKCHFRKRFRRS